MSENADIRLGRAQCIHVRQVAEGDDDSHGGNVCKFFRCVVRSVRRPSPLMRVLAGGDKKRAMRRLRSGNMHKNHHFSTFRTGIMIGLAIPALADGLVKGLDSAKAFDLTLMAYFSLSVFDARKYPCLGCSSFCLCGYPHPGPLLHLGGCQLAGLGPSSHQLRFYLRCGISSTNVALVHYYCRIGCPDSARSPRIFRGMLFDTNIIPWLTEISFRVFCCVH